MITTRYHLEFEIEEEIYQHFGHTNEFERNYLECIRGSINCETDLVCEPTIYASFSSMTEAHSAETRLKIMIENYRKRLEITQ